MTYIVDPVNNTLIDVDDSPDQQTVGAKLLTVPSLNLPASKPKAQTPRTNKQNPLDSVIPNIEKGVDLYDDVPDVNNKREVQKFIVANTNDPNVKKRLEARMATNSRTPKKISSAIDNWKLYKSTASPSELKELLATEERAKPLTERAAFKARMAAIDAKIQAAKVAADAFFKHQATQEQEEKTLDQLTTKKPDPDLEKGLGYLTGYKNI